MGPEVDISTFQGQLGSVASSSSIPASALVVPEVKAMLSRPRGDDNGVFVVQDLQDNFSFILCYITSTPISLIIPDILIAIHLILEIS